MSEDDSGLEGRSLRRFSGPRSSVTVSVWRADGGGANEVPVARFGFERPIGTVKKKSRSCDETVNEGRRICYHVLEVCSIRSLQKKRKPMSNIAPGSEARYSPESAAFLHRCHGNSIFAFSTHSDVHFCQPDRRSPDHRSAELDAGCSLIYRRHVGKARRGANRGNVQKGHQRRK